MLRSGEINFLADFTGDPKVLLNAAEQDGDLEVVSTVEMGFRYMASTSVARRSTIRPSATPCQRQSIAG